MEERNKRLMGMVSAEREKVAGYKQLAKVHSAYIAILLQKLGAIKESPAVIRAEDVTEALAKKEVRVLSYEDGSWGLYVELTDEE